jgi:predicted dienelactone hydrolase
VIGVATLMNHQREESIVPVSTPSRAPRARVSLRRRLTSLLAVAAALATAAVLPAAPAQASEPANGSLHVYSSTVGADAADIYYVQKPAGTKLPFVLLLQGGNVDKANYAKYAKLLSSHGFVVIVPNHPRTVFPGTSGLYAEQSQVNAAVAWAAAENVRTGSPINGKIATDTMALTGHSFGGAAGLYAVEGTCQVPFCFGFYARPTQLKAASFFGTNTVQGGFADPIDLGGVPTQLIQGAADGIAAPAAAQATFDGMTGAGRALVTLNGVNHYGVCDTDDPAGSILDPNVPTTSQNLAYSTVALWSAMWIKAQLGDPLAHSFVYDGWGDAISSVASQQLAG